MVSLTVHPPYLGRELAYYSIYSIIVEWCQWVQASLYYWDGHISRQEPGKGQARKWGKSRQERKTELRGWHKIHVKFRGCHLSVSSGKLSSSPISRDHPFPTWIIWKIASRSVRWNPTSIGVWSSKWICFQACQRIAVWGRAPTFFEWRTDCFTLLFSQLEDGILIE